MIKILDKLREAFPQIDWRHTDDVAPERVEAYLGDGVKLVVSYRLYNLKDKDPWGTRELWFWAQLIDPPGGAFVPRNVTPALEDACPVGAVRKVLARCKRIADIHASLAPLLGEIDD